MIMFFEDPFGPWEEPTPEKTPLERLPMRFAVSEGAGRQVTFWLAVAGVLGLLAIAAMARSTPH